MPSFEDSYLGQLRKLVGDQKIILPATRAVIQDGNGRVLFIRRRDNDKWGMPAGGMELGESIYDCLRREVKEETGLDVISATPIAIHSEPRFAFTDAYGAEYQMLAVVFRVDEWSGSLLTSTDETTDARFFHPHEVPELRELYRETLEDLRNYDGRLIVK